MVFDRGIFRFLEIVLIRLTRSVLHSVELLPLNHSRLSTDDRDIHTHHVPDSVITDTLDGVHRTPR